MGGNPVNGNHSARHPLPGSDSEGRSAPFSDRSVICGGGFHRNSTTHRNASPSTVLSGLALACLVVGVVFEVQKVALWLVTIQEVRNGLLTLKEDFDEVTSQVSVFVVVERSRKTFVSNASSTACLLLVQ